MSTKRSPLEESSHTYNIHFVWYIYYITKNWICKAFFTFFSWCVHFWFDRNSLPRKNCFDSFGGGFFTLRLRKIARQFAEWWAQPSFYTPFRWSPDAQKGICWNSLTRGSPQGAFLVLLPCMAWPWHHLFPSYLQIYFLPLKRKYTWLFWCFYE